MRHVRSVEEARRPRIRRCRCLPLWKPCRRSDRLASSPAIEWRVHRGVVAMPFRCHPEPGRQRRDRSEVVRDLAGLGGHLAIRRGRVLSRPAARGPRTSSSSSSSSSSSLGWNEPVTVTLTIPARSACCCEEVASQRGTMDRHIPIPHCATLPPINGRKL
jgi:hypothetical protein